MNCWHAIALGAVQGITEFLPVSSSAHLLLLPKLFNIPYQGKEFDVFLNIGSLLAILVFFNSYIFKLLFGFKDFVINNHTTNRYFFVTLLLSSLPTIIVFGIAEIFFKVEIQSFLLMGIMMIICAILLYIVDRNPTVKSHVNRTDSIMVGFAQTASLIPGVSRLGACLTMMRYMNYSREESFKFSMILSIPPVAGACTLKLIKILMSDGTYDWSMIAVGCVSSFVFGLISLNAVSCFLRYFTLLPIIIYRLLLGIILLYFV